MRFELIDFYSLSIGFAAIIGGVRFRNIHPTFRPFIYLCWIAFANEILSYFLVYNGYYTSRNITVYIILEVLLIMWQMYNWNVWRRPRWVLPALGIFWIMLWLIEPVWLYKLGQTNSVFWLLASFQFVLMAIVSLRDQLNLERHSLLKNPIIIISIVFIIYFTCNVISGVFWLELFGGSLDFQSKVFGIMIYINFVANLLYAVAVLWMPKKLRFTLPY